VSRTSSCTGHYGCGGVRSALRDDKLGLVDNWLRHVQDVQLKHQVQLDELLTEEDRVNRLCELNVVEQVVNVAQTTVVRDAWARGQSLCVHGWIYGLGDGRLRDVGITVSKADEVQSRADAARMSSS
jgi:Carbonic anhydrase